MKLIDRFRFISSSLLNQADDLSDNSCRKKYLILNIYLNMQKQNDEPSISKFPHSEK